MYIYHTNGQRQILSIPCLCPALQLNKYERWNDGTMSGLSVPRAMSSHQNMALRMWHSLADTSQSYTHTLTHPNWLWPILPSRHSDYIQNGAHMKQYKVWRNQNCIFHLMWLKVRAKLMTEVSQHLQQEFVWILCRWRIRHLNKSPSEMGQIEVLEDFENVCSFHLKKN